MPLFYYIQIPQAYRDKGVRFWLICNLCEQYLETVPGAKRHILGMKHVENKIVRDLADIY